MNRLALIAICISMFSFWNPCALAIEVPLGDWLQEDVEGLSSVTGTGDTFTASPGDSTGAADPFAARQKVYQQFAQPVDFSSNNQTISISFDVVINAIPDVNDTDFRFSFVDTSTNQGFYPASFDLGDFAGTYLRTRFVDQLDGPGGGDDGFDPNWGGSFIDAINGNGTIAQIGGPPVGALGLVRDNTVSFHAELSRTSSTEFFFDVQVTEDDGAISHTAVIGGFDPAFAASGFPSPGDDEIQGVAINQFDGVVFGIFDDQPFTGAGDFNDDGTVDAADYTVWQDNFGAAAGTLPNDVDGGVIGNAQYQTWQDNFGATESYTVSNIVIEATALVDSLVVPEPGSLSLLMVASAAGLLMQRRRKS